MNEFDSSSAAAEDQESAAAGAPKALGVEEACARLEALAQEALESARSLSGALRKLVSIAKDGRLRDLRKVHETCRALSARLREHADKMAPVASFDYKTALSSQSYTEELVRAAQDGGLSLREDDSLLYCFPHIVRILPSDGAVTVGQVREYRLRPTALVRRLQEEQRKPVRFAPQQFVQLLYSAYLLALPREAPLDGVSGFAVPLSRLYSILTLFPGVSKQYTVEEFSRDVYLLDKSGVTETKGGAMLSFSGSTGTRSAQATLRVVTEAGDETRYYGVSFQRRLTEP